MIKDKRTANVRLNQVSGVTDTYKIGIVSPNDYSYEGGGEHYTRAIEMQTVTPENADRVINVPAGCSIAMEVTSNTTFAGKINAETELKAIRNVKIDGYTGYFMIFKALNGGDYMFLLVKAVS